MLLLLGSRPAPGLAAWLRSAGGPDAGAAGGMVEGRAIADRAPPAWRWLVALDGQPGSPGTFPAAPPGEDQGAAPDLFRATPLGDVMIGDPAPAERIAACLVFANPVDGREAAFNDWYSNRHLPDVLRVPGYLSARRFALAGAPGQAPPGWRYLAVYEVDYARYAAATAEVAIRSGTALMPISDAAQRPLAAHFLLPEGKRLLCGVRAEN